MKFSRVLYCDHFVYFMTEAHYKERWEDQQAMYIGLRYPEDRKKRKRRKQSRSGKGASFDEQEKPSEPGKNFLVVHLVHCACAV